MASSGAKKIKAEEKPGKSPAVLPALTPSERVDLLRKMVLIRRFEQKAAKAFMQAKIRGFCHLYIGQEAVAVGSISTLNPTDAVITGYRDHGHALARGMGSRECMAELFGKITGCSRGKGGSMHFFSKEKHFHGGHGIVGGQTPLAAGIAFAQKYQGTGEITVCYLGDGAVNQGAFHESLNLAALWKLPVIFVIENNEYSMGTNQARSSAGYPLVKRAGGYDMVGTTADGSDVDDVRARMWDAVQLARTQSLPSLVEIKTYRYRGHSMSDPGSYRSKEEIAERKKESEPISTFKTRLYKEKALTEKEYEEIERQAVAEADDAIAFAEASPEPDVATVFEDIHTPEDQIAEFRPPVGN
ncbi:MAG: pyruvate dehydrogenase (acetyl-transferring) E1 component subunit alpha [Verrucomicrobia bacterium]|nr:pyruvate dehydrogenase (acetyl-transferring) E1 component subunit alpha [Verrucomicrobiota bacterium]